MIIRYLYTSRRIPTPVIEYVQHTNAIPLRFELMDYDPPEGASARVYLLRSDGTCEYDTAELDLTGDHPAIVVTPTTSLFSESGPGILQVQVTNGDTVYVSYPVQVIVYTNHADGTPAGNLTNVFDEVLEDMEAAIEDLPNHLPVATVERIDDGARITITDKDGTTTADIYDADEAVREQVDNLEYGLAKVGQIKSSTNLINPNTVTRDKRITISGQLVDQEGDYLSDYIPVEEGQILCWCKQWSTGTIRAQGRAICAYDSEKVAIPGAGIQRTIYYYTVPAGVSYVRVAIVSGTNASVTVEPEDVMVFLSDTETPSSYTFEEWFAEDFIVDASFSDHSGGGVDVNLFGDTETLARYSDIEDVKAAEDTESKVSVVRYSMADNVFICKETRTSNGSIYITFGALQSENPFLAIPFSTLTAAFPDNVETLDDGRQYLRIESRKAILYDYTTRTFRMVDIRNRAAGTYINLAQCCNGMLVDGILFHAINRAETVRNSRTAAMRSRTDDTIYDFSKRVQEDQTDRTLTILLMTDTHIDSTKHPDWDNAIDLVEKFGAVTRQCGIGLAVHGGDILTLGYSDKTIPLQTLNRFTAALRNNITGTPLAVLKGNHDDSSYGPKNGGVQTFNLARTGLIGPEQWGVCVACPQRSMQPSLVYDQENPNGGYCYLDDPVSKIRVIMLNTNDNPSTMTDSDTYKYNSTVYGFQERQLAWLADVLKLSDKTDPADWGVYIISHIPIEYSHNRDGSGHGTWFGMGGYVRGARAFFAILDGYINGTSGTASETVDVSDWTIDVAFDFDGRAGTFLGFLCGHMHADNSSAGVGGASAPEYGHRYIGITAGLTFAAVTLDRSSGEVHVRKWGGYNHIGPTDNPYDSIIGLTDGDVNEFGDFTVTM